MPLDEVTLSPDASARLASSTILALIVFAVLEEDRPTGAHPGRNALAGTPVKGIES